MFYKKKKGKKKREELIKEMISFAINVDDIMFLSCLLTCLIVLSTFYKRNLHNLLIA